MNSAELFEKGAALLASGAPVTPEIAKTHSGLISVFSLHLVKTGRVTVDLGKALNKVEDLRLIADYKGEAIDASDARWAVEQAQNFAQSIDAPRACLRWSGALAANASMTNSTAIYPGKPPSTAISLRATRN